MDGAGKKPVSRRRGRRRDEIPKRLLAWLAPYQINELFAPNLIHRAAMASIFLVRTGNRADGAHAHPQAGVIPHALGENVPAGSSDAHPAGPALATITNPNITYCPTGKPMWFVLLSLPSESRMIWRNRRRSVIRFCNNAGPTFSRFGARGACAPVPSAVAG